MNTDPIADFLTRIRNGVMAGNKVVEIPASNIKKQMTKILFEKGYILNYKFEDEGPQGNIKVALKYSKSNNTSAIKSIQRVSKPGMRSYTNSKELPRVLNGLGIAIISTSQVKKSGLLSLCLSTFTLFSPSTNTLTVPSGSFKSCKTLLKQPY